MTLPRLLRVVLAAGALSLTGCAGASLCEAAGGSYTGSTSTRWSQGQEAASEWCQANGGVYLGGQDRCEWGSGGP
jgi:hypothetical protein